MSRNAAEKPGVRAPLDQEDGMTQRQKDRTPTYPESDGEGAEGRGTADIAKRGPGETGITRS